MRCMGATRDRIAVGIRDVKWFVGVAEPRVGREYWNGVGRQNNRPNQGEPNGGQGDVQITKAVITAAGRGARQYPASDTVQKAMLPLVDRDGLTKPVLQIIAEEALESGIEEICVVCAPGDEAVYRRHFRAYAETLRSAFKGSEWAEVQVRRLVELEPRLRFAVQDEPLGYGHAVWCARQYAADDPVLLLLGDHLYISREARRCARQLLDVAEAKSCAVSAVQATREHLIHQYGTIQGTRLSDRPDVYTIDEVIEKPTPTLAELRLQVPGLRAGHYLCYFGMHVLTSSVFDLLDDLVARDVREGGSIQLTTALDALARRETYLALETKGARHNLGVTYGVVEAQIALAMAGVDRERMLALLLESVVRVEQNAGPEDMNHG
jgi:UTP--glucose-1-phosphate uridylyltransferase